MGRLSAYNPETKQWEYLESGGSGSGGTNKYSELTEKPQINGVELNGNKTSSDLGLAGKDDLPVVPTKVSELTNDSNYIDNSITVSTTEPQDKNKLWFNPEESDVDPSDALQPLTFTGGATGMYDGTKALTVDIPVESGEWVKVVDYTEPTEVSLLEVTKDINGRPLNLNASEVDIFYIIAPCSKNIKKSNAFYRINNQNVHYSINTIYQSQYHTYMEATYNNVGILKTYRNGSFLYGNSKSISGSIDHPYLMLKQMMQFSNITSLGISTEKAGDLLGSGTRIICFAKRITK